MKKHIYHILLIAIFVSSCGGGSKNTTTQAKEPVAEPPLTSETSTLDCAVDAGEIKFVKLSTGDVVASPEKSENQLADKFRQSIGGKMIAVAKIKDGESGGETIVWSEGHKVYAGKNSAPVELTSVVRDVAVLKTDISTSVLVATDSGFYRFKADKIGTDNYELTEDPQVFTAFGAVSRISVSDNGNIYVVAGGNIYLFENQTMLANMGCVYLVYSAAENLNAGGVPYGATDLASKGDDVVFITKTYSDDDFDSLDELKDHWGADDKIMEERAFIVNVALRETPREIERTMAYFNHLYFSDVHVDDKYIYFAAMRFNGTDYAHAEAGVVAYENKDARPLVISFAAMPAAKQSDYFMFKFDLDGENAFVRGETTAGIVKNILSEPALQAWDFYSGTAQLEKAYPKDAVIYNDEDGTKKLASTFLYEGAKAVEDLSVAKDTVTYIASQFSNDNIFAFDGERIYYLDDDNIPSAIFTAELAEVKYDVANVDDEVSISVGPTLVTILTSNDLGGTVHIFQKDRKPLNGEGDRLAFITLNSTTLSGMKARDVRVLDSTGGESALIFVLASSNSGGTTSFKTLAYKFERGIGATFIASTKIKKVIGPTFGEPRFAGNVSYENDSIAHLIKFTIPVEAKIYETNGLSAEFRMCSAFVPTCVETKDIFEPVDPYAENSLEFAYNGDLVAAYHADGTFYVAAELGVPYAEDLGAGLDPIFIEPLMGGFVLGGVAPTGKYALYISLPEGTSEAFTISKYDQIKPLAARAFGNKLIIVERDGGFELYEF